MALKQRLISKLLIEDGVAVKYRRFTDDRRVVGDPVSLCHVQSAQILDEFHFCFIGTADPELVREMNRACMTACSVSGSIHTTEQVDELIRECGVDKIVTKSDTVGWYVAERYGRQAAVWCHTYGGDAAFAEVPEWAGEILLTSVDRDGCGTGVDIGALRFPWSRPVVVAGGVGRLGHVKDALEAGADGVAVSSMFAFTDSNAVKLRSWLVSSGCNVRIA